MKIHSWIFIVFGSVGLVLVYVFQDQLFSDPFSNFVYDPVLNNYPDFNKWNYISNKAFRFILNDGFAILLIYGIFGKGDYVRFAALIFMIGFLILLPIYLVLVINYFHESYAYLNHLHRLVLNPVLMMLLIPAFYAQKLRAA